MIGAQSEVAATPRYAIEFPDFPASDMPSLPPYLVDSSWHNDACPSFRVAGSGYGAATHLYVDYSDPAISEMPHLGRFSLYATDKSGNETRSTYHGSDESEMLRHVQIERVAYEFAQSLAHDLDATEWQAMRLRNRDVPPGVCASHDFRDANMNMADAFESVIGHSALSGADDSAEQRANFAIWNAAFELATRVYLTADVEGARFDAWRLTGRDVADLGAEGIDECEGIAGRLYDGNCHVERSGAEWHCAVSNITELFPTLYDAESFLWDCHGEEVTSVWESAS